MHARGNPVRTAHIRQQHLYHPSPPLQQSVQLTALAPLRSNRLDTPTTPAAAARLAAAAETTYAAADIIVVAAAAIAAPTPIAATAASGGGCQGQKE